MLSDINPNEAYNNLMQINKSLFEIPRKMFHKPNMERENAYRAYCKIYNTTKRAAKTKYYADILEERKYSIKYTWITLRQVISKQTCS